MTDQHKKSHNQKAAYLKYVVALLLFGSNGIVASHIALTSYEIVFLRTLIGSLLLVLLYFLGESRRRYAGARTPKPFKSMDKRHLLSLVISGVAMGISWMFLYEAYQQIGVSIASLAYYCGPVIVMALSPLLFRERFTLTRLVGFAAVLCGILFINVQAFHDGKNGWGLFCGVMSAVMYAVMVIFNKKAVSITGMKNSVLQLTVSFLTVAVFIGFRQGFVLTVSQSDWTPILLLGLVNTGIGCYLYFSSIGRLPVQSVAVLGYLEPLSAVAFSVLLLKEILLPIQVVGAVLILGGALFAEGIFKRT